MAISMPFGEPGRRSLILWYHTMSDIKCAAQSHCEVRPANQHTAPLKGSAMPVQGYIHEAVRVFGDQLL